MWCFIKTVLRVDPASVEYFGPFRTQDEAEDYVERCFDPDDVEITYLAMFDPGSFGRHSK